MWIRPTRWGASVSPAFRQLRRRGECHLCRHRQRRRRLPIRPDDLKRPEIHVVRPGGMVMAEVRIRNAMKRLDTWIVVGGASVVALAWWIRFLGPSGKGPRLLRIRRVRTTGRCRRLTRGFSRGVQSLDAPAVHELPSGGRCTAPGGRQPCACAKRPARPGRQGKICPQMCELSSACQPARLEHAAGQPQLAPPAAGDEDGIPGESPARWLAS